MREKDIEQSFCRKLQKRGCLTPKISDNPGWPDRLVIAPGGKHCFIEFKRPVGKLSPIQIAITSQIAELGHTVFVINSCTDIGVDEVMKSIQD